jgi:predicted NUDIX family NTP pyrophosphohydrolase
VFGQVQDLGAVREERRAPGAEIEPPCIELGERGDQVGGDVALTFSQRTDVDKECSI